MTFLTSTLDWGGHRHARPLYIRGKSPRYPLDRRSGGAKSRSGRGGEEKNIFIPAENRTPVIQLVA